MAEDTTATAPDEGAAPDEGQQGKTFTQAEVDALIAKRAERVARQQYGGIKPEDIATLQERAEQYDTLVAASRTDQERAVEEARRAAAAEASTTYGRRLVAAEFRAAGAANGVSGERVAAYLEDADLSKFLDKKGEVDLERVTNRVKTLGPDKREPAFPDLGGGKRGEPTNRVDMNRILRGAAGFTP